MKPSITLALQYYRLLLIYNIAFTIVGIFLAYMSVGHLNAGVFWYGKMVGFAGAFGLYHFSSKPTYFYFYNAGYRVRKIVSIAFYIDIAVYILMVLVLKLVSLCLHLF